MHYLQISNRYKNLFNIQGIIVRRLSILFLWKMINLEFHIIHVFHDLPNLFVNLIF